MPVSDADAVAFLRWALPRMGYRWRGFRHVRRQVRRRLARRLGELGLCDLDAYGAHLESHAGEWSWLDAACRITISRFYRDRGMWEALVADVVPRLAALAQQRGDAELRAWSAGCASGEEAYTLRIAWERWTEAPLPLQILGTDIDAAVLARARAARYREGTLKSLPASWRKDAFDRDGDELVLREHLHCDVRFERRDIRGEPPAGPFHLILCRNLGLTYFVEDRQLEMMGRVLRVLVPGGALVIGGHERLPEALSDSLAGWHEKLCIFCRSDASG